MAPGTGIHVAGIGQLLMDMDSSLCRRGDIKKDGAKYLFCKAGECLY